MAAEDVAPVPLKRKEEDAKTVVVGKAVTLMNEEDGKAVTLMNEEDGKAVTLMNEEDGNAEETPELNENKVLVP